MSKKTDLKACPFCGRKPEVHLVAGIWFVQCECGVKVTITPTQGQVFDTWNRRRNK